MTEKDNSGSAFPFQAHNTANAYDPEFGMSIRAYAAIKLCVPDSGIDWLDSMIRTALRDRFAGQALSVVARSTGGSMRGQGPLSPPERLREPGAISFADAMLAHSSQSSGTKEDAA